MNKLVALFAFTALLVSCPTTPTPQPSPTVNSVSVEPSTAALQVGGTRQLTATVSVTNGASQAVNWSVNPAGVVTVSSTGLVTAVGPGTVTVTATSQANPNRTGSSTITVSAPSTLYRGDWGWAAINVNDSNDIVGGLASFSVEARSTTGPQIGQRFAGGLFDVEGLTPKPYGLALMGAISTPLDAGFSVGSTNTVLMVATDLNGQIEAGTNGRPTFVGPGRFFFAARTVDVAVAFVQVDGDPTYQGAAAPVVTPARLLPAIHGVDTPVTSSAYRSAMALAEKIAAGAVKAEHSGFLAQSLR